MPPRRAAAGFTFVELMVVLAILSFAFAYGIIHLDGATGPARLSAAARQVGANIEFLRGHAVQASRPLELTVDISNARWRTRMPPRVGEAEARRQDQEDVLFTEWVELPEHIRIEGIQLDSQEIKDSGEIVITFSPLGEISPNGFLVRLISDEIADQEQASFSVEVNGLTGEIAYLPGYAPFDQVVKGESF